MEKYQKLLEKIDIEFWGVWQENQADLCSKMGSTSIGVYTNKTYVLVILYHSNIL